MYMCERVIGWGGSKRSFKNTNAVDLICFHEKCKNIFGVIMKLWQDELDCGGQLITELIRLVNYHVLGN